MSKLAGWQLFTAPTSPVPAVVKNRASVARELRPGAVPHGAVPHCYGAGLRVRRRAQAHTSYDDEVILVSPSSFCPANGLKDSPTYKSSCCLKLWGEMNPHLAINDVTLCPRLGFKLYLPTSSALNEFSDSSPHWKENPTRQPQPSTTAQLRTTWPSRTASGRHVRMALTRSSRSPRRCRSLERARCSSVSRPSH